MNKKRCLRTAAWLCLTLASPDLHAQWSTSLNAPTAAFFGTSNNYPLRFYTNNVNHMHMNAAVTNNINSQGNMVRDGFLGLGKNYTPSFTWNNNTGPLSLLHLSGDDGTFLATLGYRNWMKNGITFTANDDIMFVGPRRTGANDVTDALIAWGDNATAVGGFGPDNLIFSFTNGDGSVPGDLTGNAPYGREIVRMTGTGNVGVGPVFSNSSQPQSQLHINPEGVLPAWLQISSQSGTGQLATDGLRMGVSSSTAYLYQQENYPLIFSTNANTNSLSAERVRITQIGALGTPAVPNPNGANINNMTRMGVSLFPLNPLNAPYSLVHIGTPHTAAFGNNGQRDWMNVGYNATYDNDNLYLGMKNEGAGRQDAVLAWGDEQMNNPDFLRFVFTANPNDVNATAIAKGASGQEVGRFTPEGRFGVGNFYNGSLGLVSATMDVAGDACIRSVNQNNSLTQVLVRDPNDLGRILWRDASTLGGGSGGPGFGNDCGSSPNPLTADRQVPLNNNDIYFTGQSLPSAGNTVNIGLNCGVVPTAKLNLLQDVGSLIASGSIGAYFLNKDRASQIGLSYAGVTGEASGLQTQTRITNVGGDFKASGATMNYAVRGTASIVTGGSAGNNANNCGGYFTANGAGFNNFGATVSGMNAASNWGINSSAFSAATNTTANTGGHFGATGTGNNNTGVSAYSAYPSNATSASRSFGVSATTVYNSGGASLPTNTAIGVFGAAYNFPGSINTYAGYFDGNVYINGPMNGTGFALTSDASFKTNLDSIVNADSLISLLQPRTFDFIDGSSIHMNFPEKKQYGFIAQEVETVIPELVSTIIRPAMADSTDSLIYPELRYKAVNYTGFIALLMQNAKEQNEKIAQLSQQLADLQQTVNGCCGQARPQETGTTETPAGAVIQTRLQNADEPSLGQNIPNPFESATRIPVYLPQHIRKAELLFYGHDGKILQNVLISERGNVQVDVNSESLSSGIYSYTLFTDGKPTETRKMIKR